MLQGASTSRSIHSLVEAHCVLLPSKVHSLQVRLDVTIPHPNPSQPHPTRLATPYPRLDYPGQTATSRAAVPSPKPPNLGPSNSVTDAQNFSFTHIFHTHTMASLLPRQFSRSVRQLSRQQYGPVAFVTRRYASNKHPKGFVPPTQADLAELRESVKDFARK